MEEYTEAEITLMNGKVYPDVKAKFNLLDRELTFQNEKNEELICTSPIKSIRFFSSIVNGVHYDEIKIASIDTALNTPEAPIYQILEDGNARLLKHLSVVYTDQKRYGEATITRIFKKKEQYLAKLPDSAELKKVDRNKSDLAILFGKKQVQVSSYIETNKLKCKSDEDLIRVFKYYNSL